MYSSGSNRTVRPLRPPYPVAIVRESVGPDRDTSGTGSAREGNTGGGGKVGGVLTWEGRRNRGRIGPLVGLGERGGRTDTRDPLEGEGETWEIRVFVTLTFSTKDPRTKVEETRLRTSDLTKDLTGTAFGHHDYDEEPLRRSSDFGPSTETLEEGREGVWRFRPSYPPSPVPTTGGTRLPVGLFNSPTGLQCVVVRSSGSYLYPRLPLHRTHVSSPVDESRGNRPPPCYRGNGRDDR